MIKLFLLIIFISCFAQPPELPKDWYSLEDLDQVVNQGGKFVPKAGFCCDPDVQGQCRIQYQSTFRKHWVAATQNRTKLSDDDDTIVNIYHPIYKQLEINPETKVCQRWCPLSGNLRPLAIDPKAKNMGDKIVEDQQCTEWMWEEKMPVLEIIIARHSMFVKNDGATTVPVKRVQRMMPFGMEIGTSNVTFLEYHHGGLDPKLFEVKGIEVCPKAKDCENTNSAFYKSKLMDLEFSGDYHEIIQNEFKKRN